MAVEEKQAVRFGPFEFYPQSGELFKNSQKLKLEGQPLQVLAILLDRPGMLVSREEISKRLWPADTFVDSERILNVDIWKLRQALEDNAENPQYIETLPKRGYRFVQDSLAVPKPVVSSPQTHPSRSRHRRYRWTSATIAFLGSILWLAIVGYWLGRPATPRIVGTHRLTNTGLKKSGYGGWCFLATDGLRVYFQELRAGHEWALSQVSVKGGDISDLRTPIKNVPCLQGIKADGSELLATETSWTGGFAQEVPRWSISVPAGSARKLPVNTNGFWSVWSRDGKEIFYSANADRDLYRLDLQNGTSRKIQSGKDVTYLRISPDGTVLRFTSLIGPPGSTINSGIWEVRSDGSNLHRVFPETNVFFGNWTPDGNLFFFYKAEGSGSSFEPSFRSYLWAVPEHRRWYELQRPKPTLLYAGPLQLLSPTASKDGKQLFVIGVEARGELSIYDAHSRQFVSYLSGIQASHVTFSPDGQWIAYVDHPHGNLWRSKIDGTERLQLTFPPMGVMLPRWSPDGKLIVFMEWYSSENHKIYAISPDGGNPDLLLTGEFQPADPTWSPDGQFIAYGGCHCAWSEIRLYDIKTATSAKVPDSEGYFSPRWSPDGKYLIALNERSNEIGLFEFATRKWKVLVRDVPFGWPSWSRDSKHVYGMGQRQDEIVRVSIQTGRVEPIADLKDVRRTGPSSTWRWFGLTPDDHIMIMRDTGNEDIYALDLEY